MSQSVPLGLHLHLVAVGPTLRFALWFERALEPLAFKTVKRAGRDPLRAPGLLPTLRGLRSPPPGLPPRRLVAALPRLGNYLPVPLPGLITAWDLPQFSAKRTLGVALYLLEVSLLPPRLSLHALRRLLHDHATGGRT